MKTAVIECEGSPTPKMRYPLYPATLTVAENSQTSEHVGLQRTGHVVTVQESLRAQSETLLCSKIQNKDDCQRAEKVKTHTKLRRNVF